MIHPAAISWHITSVHIASFKREALFESFSHILMKVYENHPSLTDKNSTSAIELIVLVSLVIATTYHASP